MIECDKCGATYPIKGKGCIKCSVCGNKMCSGD